MYIYIENRYFISLKEIITIIEINEQNSDYFEKLTRGNSKKTIDLSRKKKKSIIITDKYIYISSYTNRALYSRALEYRKLKKKGRVGGKI